MVSKQGVINAHPEESQQPLAATTRIRGETLSAYYQHIVYLRARGVQIVPKSWAKNLARYVGFFGWMIDEDDAEAWLVSVMNGTWHPGAE